MKAGRFYVAGKEKEKATEGSAKSDGENTVGEGCEKEEWSTRSGRCEKRGVRKGKDSWSTPNLDCGGEVGNIKGHTREANNGPGRRVWNYGKNNRTRGRDETPMICTRRRVWTRKTTTHCKGTVREGGRRVRWQ